MWGKNRAYRQKARRHPRAFGSDHRAVAAHRAVDHQVADHLAADHRAADHRVADHREEKNLQGCLQGTVVVALGS